MRFTQTQKVDKKREKRANVLSKCQRPKLNKYTVITLKMKNFQDKLQTSTFLVAYCFPDISWLSVKKARC